MTNALTSAERISMLDNLPKAPTRVTALGRLSVVRAGMLTICVGPTGALVGLGIVDEFGNVMATEVAGGRP